MEKCQTPALCSNIGDFENINWAVVMSKDNSFQWGFYHGRMITKYSDGTCRVYNHREDVYPLHTKVEPNESGLGFWHYFSDVQSCCYAISTAEMAGQQ